MEDVVAVAVTLDTGARRFFMTWGRIQDVVDPLPVEALVLQRSSRVSLGGEPISASLCNTLQEAHDQPYFYEALLSFAADPIPFGPDYEQWRAQRANEMEAGHGIYYLGEP